MQGKEENERKESCCRKYFLMIEKLCLEAVSDRASMTGQSRAIKAWNLSKLVAPGGFEVSYEYEFKEQAVTENSLTYTKAAYIGKISDSYGKLDRFLYQDKGWSVDGRKAREYIDRIKKSPQIALIIIKANMKRSIYQKFLYRISMLRFIVFSLAMN